MVDPCGNLFLTCCLLTFLVSVADAFSIRRLRLWQMHGVDCSAGASHYGIGDIELLAAETHKFESRYVDTLIAPRTDAGLAVYRERSPVHHLDRVACPVALFQGDEDQVLQIRGKQNVCGVCVCVFVCVFACTTAV